MYRTRYDGRMQNEIPSAAEVRERLEALSRSQLIELAEKTDTPFHTLRKIKSGETLDPKLETVRAVWPTLCGKKRRPSKQEA